MEKRLAIFSPNKSSYSETFIHLQRNLPYFIRFYNNGLLPTELEGTGNIINYSIKNRVIAKFNKALSLQERCLAQSLLKEKIDCVLVQYGPTACETLRVVKYLQLPLVVHFHGYDASVKELIAYYADGYKAVFEYARAIICVSEKMKQVLISLGCPVAKLHINIYGPDASYLQLNNDYNSKKFLTVGRFVDKKAPYLTLMAFKKLLQKFPDAELVMIGDGTLLNSCKNLRTALSINNVTFTGALSVADIQKHMSDSIAFLQHSVVAENGDSEGTPVAILEAQAAGLPVISTRHAGIPEVVIHGETGFLVNELDVEGMAERMINLLEKQFTAKEMGLKGRNRVLTYFTIERYLTNLTSIIAEAIDVDKKSRLN